MTKEDEQPRFRRGENAKKPYGGDVSSEPFPKALHELAVSRGFESQKSLGKALGKKGHNAVGQWYRGESIPLPDELGKLLVLLEPNDEELDAFVEPYAELLKQGKGGHGREANIKHSSRTIKPSNSPIGRWLENTCKEKKITLIELGKVLSHANLGLQGRNRLGLNTLSNMLQIFPETLGLSEEEVEALSEAVAQTIQQKLEQGHGYQADYVSGGIVRRLQKDAVCRTYNGAEAGRMLGVSRERISKLGLGFGLKVPYLEQDVEIMRKHLEETREIREKIKTTRIRNRLNAP